MEITLFAIGYIISVVVSWFLIRVAINSDGNPESHPQFMLAIFTLIPLVNVLLGVYGLIMFGGFDFNRIDFFKVNKK
ncbi:hypothetical protein [Bacillus sp. UMB0728]|uniref:hypothetical protein n=1 Tax=Bacillus sp. UMB0728 TaxID=2066052 RepID=UPI000C75680D|nr:hypothetical protein [Bacillus sp. UMB0728]PLR72229.1 hypothetical protein CYJ37_11785 [Bacillus sp. UMB0728]